MSTTPRLAGIGASLSDIGGDLDRVRAQLDELIGLGADAAELYATALGVVADARLIPERIRELKSVSAERAISITLHAPIPIDLMDRDNIALHRAAGRVSIDLAAEIGAKVVVIHAGRAHPDVWSAEPDALLDFELEELSALGDQAVAAGVRIGLENISPNPTVIAGRLTSYSLDPTLLARQIRALDHPGVVGCLDYSHANQGAGMLNLDPIEGARALAPVTGHIHISEASGVPAIPSVTSQPDWMYFGIGDMHAPLGIGCMDLDALADVSTVLPGTLAILELQGHARGMLADSLTRLRVFADRVNALPVAA
jgi:sugar phosphate isomerase/epimerase